MTAQSSTRTRLKEGFRFLAISALIANFAAQPAFAWGAQGHHMISRIAAENLPATVPLFLRNHAAIEAFDSLAPQPDHWRSKAEEELSQATAPDHFIDLEWADLAGPLPRRRFDFLRQLNAAQAAHPDIPMTPEKIGLQPWATEEVWERLKVDMRDYRKVLASGGDAAPLQLAVLYDACWLGHYVADGSQPMHASMQYNGWTGPNPNGYATQKLSAAQIANSDLPRTPEKVGIHSKFETVYVTANIKQSEVNTIVAATPVRIIDDEWTQYLAYLRHSNSMIEKVYELDKAGAFDGKGTPEGRAFVDERMSSGAIELRDLIVSAWVHSADPVEEFRGPQ